MALTKRKGPMVALVAVLLAGVGVAVTAVAMPPKVIAGQAVGALKLVAAAARGELGTKIELCGNGMRQVTVPRFWKPLPESFPIPPEAQLTIANLDQFQVVEVVAEDKDAFDTFDDYLSTGDDVLYMEPVTTRLGRVDVSIGGLKGERLVYRAVLDGLGAVLWNTVLDGKKAYYQVVAMTWSNKRVQAWPVLKEIVESFRETAPST